MIGSTMLASAVVAASIVTAPVTSVKPVTTYQTISVPTTICNQVPVYNPGNSHGSIVGGIIGGVVGSNIARDSRNRDVVTGIGVLVGSEMGRVNNTPPSYGTTTQCAQGFDYKTVPVVSHYEVTYTYKGVSHTAYMQHNPGSYVTIDQHHTVR